MLSGRPMPPLVCRSASLEAYANIHLELPRRSTDYRRSFSKADTAICSHGIPNLSSNTRQFSNGRPSSFKTTMDAIKPSHTAFIALGSNVGERVEMIEKACLEMDRANIKVRRTSSLFETAPMYYLNQEPFMNGVCEVRPYPTCRIDLC